MKYDHICPSTALCLCYCLFVCLFKTTRDHEDCSYVHGCVIIGSMASRAVDTSQETQILLPSISKYSLPICGGALKSATSSVPGLLSWSCIDHVQATIGVVSSWLLWQRHIQKAALHIALLSTLWLSHSYAFLNSSMKYNHLLLWFQTRTPEMSLDTINPVVLRTKTMKPGGRALRTALMWGIHYVLPVIWWGAEPLTSTITHDTHNSMSWSHFCKWRRVKWWSVFSWAQDIHDESSDQANVCHRYKVCPLARSINLPRVGIWNLVFHSEAFLWWTCFLARWHWCMEPTLVVTVVPLDELFTQPSSLVPDLGIMSS